MLVNRSKYLEKLKGLLDNYPVVALIGPRQVGKTTLARTFAKHFTSVHFFDLENPADLAQLVDPLLALSSLTGLVVIDEIQHSPDLLKLLRVLVDRTPCPCQFLILGSASPDLLKQSSESLAGRIAYLEIRGFSLEEVGAEQQALLWCRGGFPRSFLANSTANSYEWRLNFIQTFLERDLPQLGISVPSPAMKRFWIMLAHYHGQLWNASEFSRAFGLSQKVINHYLDILCSTFVVMRLSPWWENISKRQVKQPKIYIRDPGILHALLQLETESELNAHPKVGASWEGFALNCLLEQLNVRDNEAFFWKAHTGVELNLFIPRGLHRIGFEFKRTSTPKLTTSMKRAEEALQLTHTYLVYPGEKSFPLSKSASALSLNDCLSVKI